ncbi:MAG: hypothetical protein JWM90_2803 [Thermoleophilia bacterium]|nr:hypothetical protein [Thermoleophilia bacterium]
MTQEDRRTELAGGRLELPRFQLRTREEPRAEARPATPRPTWNASPSGMQQPVAVTYAPAQHAPAQPQQYHQQAPVPTYAAQVAQPPVYYTPAPVAYAPAPAAPPMYAAPAPAARAPQALAATPTRPSTISWDRLAPPVATDKTLLQRITPVHMGVLLIMVVIAMVVTAGPVAMKTPTPGRLPALATGGGGDGIASPTLARAGTTATAAAVGTPPPGGIAPVSAPVSAVLPKVAAAPVVKVGSATVDVAVRHGGIPSPAAAAGLSGRGVGGGAAPSGTPGTQFEGMPSPAAAEKLGPQTLPYRPSDGMTLPRTAGERDGYAADRHYGTAGTLAMSAPVERPALTPGAAAAQAEQIVAHQDLTGTSGVPIPNEIGAF